VLDVDPEFARTDRGRSLEGVVVGGTRRGLEGARVFGRIGDGGDDRVCQLDDRSIRVVGD